MLELFLVLSVLKICIVCNICWDFTIFLVEKKHDSPYKNRLNQYSYLITPETNRERSKIREFYLQNHLKSLDFKKDIANLVKRQKHYLYHNFLFVVAFSLKCIYRWIHLLTTYIAKLFVKIKRFANSEPNTNTVAPCTQQPKKNWLTLFWFINVV